MTNKGSLNNDDCDGNENGKKAIGLDKQNNISARASRYFFLPSLHNYDVESGYRVSWRT